MSVNIPVNPDSEKLAIDYILNHTKDLGKGDLDTQFMVLKEKKSELEKLLGREKGYDKEFMKKEFNPYYIGLGEAPADYLLSKLVGTMNNTNKFGLALFYAGLLVNNRDSQPKFSTKRGEYDRDIEQLYRIFGKELGFKTKEDFEAGAREYLNSLYALRYELINNAYNKIINEGKQGDISYNELSRAYSSLINAYVQKVGTNLLAIKEMIGLEKLAEYLMNLGVAGDKDYLSQLAKSNYSPASQALNNPTQSTHQQNPASKDQPPSPYVVS